MDQKTKEPTGKGWRGDPEGHARVGRLGGLKSSGKFTKGSKRASDAGRLGGRNSSGNFKHNPERAAAAGRLGGLKSTQSLGASS
jgi:general stress protein YciG